MVETSIAQEAIVSVSKLQQDDVKVIVGESLYRKALRRLLNDWLTITMMIIIGILVVVSLMAPYLESWLDVSYTDVQLDKRFSPLGTPGHILGTDDLGRDHLARLARAGRITLGIAFFAAMISLTIGVSLGIITGYYGGVVDDVILWLVTTLNSIPSLFVLIIVAAIFRPGPITITLTLGLLGWTGTTRLVRGETFSLREREYVIGARSVGASNFYIMFLHILPNMISIVVITLAIDIGSLMLVEAALSFLGIGVQPPIPTWGNMLSNSREFFHHPGSRHLVVFPGLLITISVLCLYVIGDGIRDAFDPTLVS